MYVTAHLDEQQRKDIAIKLMNNASNMLKEANSLCLDWQCNDLLCNLIQDLEKCANHETKYVILTVEDMIESDEDDKQIDMV